MELTPPISPAPFASQVNQDPFPGPEILEAFGVQGEVLPLPGRSRKSFRVSDIVLKHVDDPIEAEWSSQVMAHLASLPLTDFEVPTPLEAINGYCVFQGWTAFEFMAGEANPERRWKQLLDVSHAFHEALCRVKQPGFLPERTHPWAVADRVAWGEASMHVRYPLRDVYNAFVDLRKDISVMSQTIHGDLAGNVLFREGMSPVILNFTPYWRPVEYADAIIIADGLLHSEQDLLLIWLGGNTSTRLQMLVRALIFRIAVANIRRNIATQDEVREFRRALEIVKAGLGADSDFHR